MPSTAKRNPDLRTSVCVGIERAAARRRAASMCWIMLRAMPNWSYILINALYHLGLALWIGGAIALGALAAPVLFRSLPRQQAGSIFGPTLRRFARLRAVALLLIVV